MYQSNYSEAYGNILHISSHYLYDIKVHWFPLRKAVFLHFSFSSIILAFMAVFSGSDYQFQKSSF